MTDSPRARLCALKRPRPQFLIVLMIWDVVVVLNLLQTFDLWNYNVS